MSTTTFPDSVAAVISIVDAAVAEPVRSQVPNPRPAAFVLVRRVGGVRRNLVVDEATISVEAWAATEQAAHDLAQSARAAIHAAQGTVVSGAGTLYRSDEIGGPAWDPDDESDQARYSFSVSVAFRGTSA
jgi:hypothetical protein